jgi:hypothetical protein
VIGLKRAVLDVLGFKGIWNRVPPAMVLGTMRRIKNVAKSIQKGEHNSWIVSDVLAAVASLTHGQLFPRSVTRHC